MPETVTIEVDDVEAETDKAILCWVDGDQVWIPKSVIDKDSEVRSKKSGKDGGTMFVAEWFARSKGWI